MGQYLIAMMLVPGLLLVWIIIQQLARRSAKLRPELGDYREEGGGCGKSCGCSTGNCKKSTIKTDE